jgi:maltooligosyltrehalose trehalohydrolase
LTVPARAAADQPERPSSELVDWHRQLIRLRQQVWAFTTGRLDETRVDFDEKHQWLRIERGPITIVCNFAQEPREVPVAPGRADVPFIASKPCSHLGRAVQMPAESVFVFGPAWEREKQVPPPF